LSGDGGRRPDGPTKQKIGTISPHTNVAPAGNYSPLSATANSGNVRSSATVSRQTCSATRQLVGPCVSFLDMPLVIYAAVEGVQIRQPAKSRCSAEKLHRPSAAVARRRFRRGHGTDLQCAPPKHVVPQHYRRVAGSLTFGKTSFAPSERACGLRTLRIRGRLDLYHSGASGSTTDKRSDSRLEMSLSNDR
jgi:hypothetical protein